MRTYEGIKLTRTPLASWSVALVAARPRAGRAGGALWPKVCFPASFLLSFLMETVHMQFFSTFKSLL